VSEHDRLCSIIDELKAENAALKRRLHNAIEEFRQYMDEDSYMAEWLDEQEASDES
jgi:hypothetical protein